ncbi:SMP-30/gluconolactonase/LRE family protein, partial [Candidatus Marinimicrobia bacterium]|nr:SMP-30/gluconolactonase/LRE family protein [Candidatus Neomarinimicrobiota bacterium]
MIGALLLIGLFSFKTIIDSGEFKSINPHFDGECIPVFGIAGPEDITVWNDSTVFISSDPRRSNISGSSFYTHLNKKSDSKQGSIFKYNIKTKHIDNLTLHIDFEFHPHGISIYEFNDRVYLNAVSHTSKGHSVVCFTLVDNQLIFIKEILSPLLVSPNDLVMINENQFYITNDHRTDKIITKLFEDYLQFPGSNILFYDGHKFEVCANKLKYANGINISKDSKKIYVAETIGKRVKIYDRNILNNDITLVETIYVNSGVDNIELDQNGDLWIGSHPKLFDFLRHAKSKENSSPSQVIFISKDSYEMKEMFLSNGNDMSGSTVAAIYNKDLLIGSVFEEH